MGTPFSIAAPNLAIPPSTYALQDQQQHRNVLRLFFNQIANAVNLVVSNILLKSSIYTITGSVGANETVLASYIMEAGSILEDDGDILKIRLFGKTAANGNNKTLKVYLGATTLYTSGAVAANNKDWEVDIVIQRASRSLQRIAVTGSYNATSIISVNTTTELLTTNLVIKATGTATTTNDIQLYGWFIEYVDST